MRNNSDLNNLLQAEEKIFLSSTKSEKEECVSNADFPPTQEFSSSNVTTFLEATISHFD